MAIFKHPLIAGISGRIGDFVFRQTADGRTIVSQRPAPSRLKPTSRQLKSRARFRQATQYAKTVLANPVRARWYDALSTP